MSVLDQFVAFAKGLSDNRRAPMEEALGAMMHTYGSEAEFSAEELAVLDKRAASDVPEYSDPQTISGLFGKPFSK